MTTFELKGLLSTVNKKSPNNSTWFTAINLTNAYLKLYFQGTECDFIKKKYADFIFASILSLVYESKDLEGKINQTKTYDMMLLETRISTYEYRKKLLFKWINSIQKGSKHNCIRTLLFFCPSLKDIKRAKELLGLNYNINCLKEELHRLTKNG